MARVTKGVSQKEKSKAKSKAKCKAKSKAKRNTKTTLQRKAKASPKTKAQAQESAKIKSMAKSQAKSEARVSSSSSTAKCKAKSKAKCNTKTTLQRKAKANPKTKAQASPKIKSKVKSQGKSEVCRLASSTATIVRRINAEWTVPKYKKSSIQVYDKRGTTVGLKVKATGRQNFSCSVCNSVAGNLAIIVQVAESIEGGMNIDDAQTLFKLLKDRQYDKRGTTV